MKVYKIGLEHEYPGSDYPTFPERSNFEGFGYRAYDDGNMELALTPKASFQATVQTFIKAASWLRENGYYPPAYDWNGPNIGLHFNLSFRKDEDNLFMSKGRSLFGIIGKQLGDAVYPPERRIQPRGNQVTSIRNAIIHGCNRVPYNTAIFVHGDAQGTIKTRYEFKWFKSNVNPYTLFKYFATLYTILGRFDSLFIERQKFPFKKVVYGCPCGCSAKRTRWELPKNINALLLDVLYGTFVDLQDVNTSEGYFSLIKEACPSDRSNLSKTLEKCEAFTDKYLEDFKGTGTDQFKPFYAFRSLG